jgi:hypothetical protein
MKALFVVFVFILSVFTFNTLYSQSYPIDKGSKLISGSFAFTSAGGDLYANSDDERVTTIMLNGSFGYFVSKGFNIGGKLLFNRQSQGDNSTTTWGVGPSVSYFFGDENSKVYPFIGGTFLYNKTTLKSKYNYGYYEVEEEYDYSGTTLAFGGGVCYMLSSAVGLFTEINYQIDNVDFEGHSFSGNKVNFMIGINAFLY